MDEDTLDIARGDAAARLMSNIDYKTLVDCVSDRMRMVSESTMLSGNSFDDYQYNRGRFTAYYEFVNLLDELVSIGNEARELVNGRL